MAFDFFKLYEIGHGQSDFEVLIEILKPFLKIFPASSGRKNLQIRGKGRMAGPEKGQIGRKGVLRIIINH